MRVLICIVFAALCAVSSSKASWVEPDRPYASVGNWQISTARFGVGCIAVYKYGDEKEISIGGEKKSDLSLIVVVERKAFSGDLDDENYVSVSIELVLDGERWSGLKPYGYRGTPGVVVPASERVLSKLVAAPTLKLTERGSLKLAVPLKDTSQALKRLAECFRDTR